MDNGSGETVQDAQRGQNRQAEPGGEYFVYFWTGRGGGGGGGGGAGGGGGGVVVLFCVVLLVMWVERVLV
ncbi:hypothetical protein EGJ88_05570 [Klebsiella pneumoniae]|nr:hypothetical protein EGJ88_05570 [Klebsiella pneumoniae]